MQLRIIAGSFGKRKIEAPDGTTTHPMGERVRGALFNMLSADIPGAIVLDAFAGAGSLGLEAISRGAAHATFIERDRTALGTLKRNSAAMQCDDKVTIIHGAVATWAARATPDIYDIIFVDPPYDDMQLSTVTALFGLLKPGGRMILSHPGRSEVPTWDGVVVVDNRSYGNANLTFYRRDT